MIWQTSTGWHFTDTFFCEQTKRGPYATEEEARRGWQAMMVYHGLKLMFT